MSEDFPGVYLPGSTRGTYVSTPLANAGWYDEGQHGGALAALIAGHVEATVPTLADMQVSRITVEIFRVVTLVPLRIATEVIRQGKRIQHVEAKVYDESDTLLSVANLQRLRVADLPLEDTAATPEMRLPMPDRVEARVSDAWGVGARKKVMFHRHAIEVREVEGGFDEEGPGTVWMRLTRPIVAGTEITPLQRIVATADFGNGISRALDFKKWVFMNPDLTVHVTRYPQGEWVALAAESAYGHQGRGVATGTLWDTSGWLGRTTQSLYLDHLA
ncbi:MAG TPA: thioesterase family protein [Acidimicrobiia bacterium]|nr:thioesterase family protein [Acidimicrobiia bacterium]